MTEDELYQNYVTELRRGSLTLAVLCCLGGPRYGYDLLLELELKGIEIEANTLYPLLRRLESQGLLTSSWETGESRPRKYYTISEKGRRVLGRLVREWSEMQDVISEILKRELYGGDETDERRN